MKKLIVLWLILTFFALINNSAFAAPPINEKIIQYRFYIKMITQLSEFKDDFTLCFENESSKIALNDEVERTFNDYNEVLNYIDCKNSNETILYDEYLKGLKEKLASKGIFPPKFDEIKINTNNIEIISEIAPDLRTGNSIDTIVPESIKITKRIYPYLYVKYFKTSNKIMLSSIYNDFLKKDPVEPGDTADVSYRKAVTHMNAAYAAYIEEQYDKSWQEFEEAIKHWESYYKLIGYSESSLKFLLGKLKMIQGSVAADAQWYNMAQNAFELAKLNFMQSAPEFQAYVTWSKCFVADLYYRQNQMTVFIKLMKEAEAVNPDFFKNLLKFKLEYNEIFVKGYAITLEYHRLSNPNFTLQTEAFKNWRADCQKTIESLLNDPTNNTLYVSKFIARYKEIIENSAMEINAVSFKDVSASNQYYIKLKKHDKEESIIPPQWCWKPFENNNSFYFQEIQPVAIVRNNKFKLHLAIYSINQAGDIIDGAKIIGRDTSNGINFNMTGKINRNKDIIVLEFESDKEISKTIKVVELSIEWHMVKDNQKNGRSLIKDFLIGKTQHKIYVVRKYVELACYWQIVEYTCDWLKNLSESDLEDANEDKVIDTIWNGCNQENLKNMGYKYVYDPQDESIPNSLFELLRTQKSRCGGWTSFLIHCFYSQGIRNIYNDPEHDVNPIIKKVHSVIIEPLDYFTTPGKNKQFNYKNDFNSIGNTPPNVFFQDHNFVGINGGFVPETIGKDEDGKDKVVGVYKGGEIFDIVYGIRIKNDNYLTLENYSIGYIKKEENDPNPEPKNDKIRQFVIKCVNVKINDEEYDDKLAWPKSE